MSESISVKQLLEAGAHFGHLTGHWHPRMKNYIFTQRNGIHILDLEQTVALLDKACAFIKDLVGKGGNVLFVGTKKQAQDIVELFLDTIKSTLKKREPVAISGFGTFKVKETKARMGRNPKTGESIQIPAKKKIAFRVSKELKAEIL